jgi:non-specific protein-tyrosine kinase
MSFLIKAVEKARKQGKGGPVLRDKSTPVHGEINRTVLQTKKPEKRDVEVNYAKTRVQTHDLGRLKNNKIISLFDDIEGTDQINLLRTQIMKKLKAIGGNSLLITSANSCEGKTFTSINLGVSISKEFDKTVLIVDADLRKPRNKHSAFSEDFFSLQVNKGLSDYLKGNAEIPEIMINPGISKLVIIPSGRPVANAAELLNSAKMEVMMSEIKSRYPDRLVIVDTPPVNQYTDAIILSRFVHGILIVVEIEKTSAEDLRKVMKNLKDMPIVGTVLNKAKD